MISKLIPPVQLMLHIFYVRVLHKANIYFVKNFLVNAQLADSLHYDVTKLNKYICSFFSSCYQ